ncbi:MAG TPA: hypothetical protein VFJ90_11955, partial [Candidatus Didemnitutus sp.]|nr:hypothetical protein [Candidatus Didemnitutus sp.]
EHEIAALWLFRGFSALLLAATAAFAWRRMDTLRIGAVGRLLFFGIVMADAKLTDFATNGMETAILVFFVMLLWSELEAPGEPRVRRLAVASAGLMWTRPDAFILAGAIILPHLVFRRTETRQSVPWSAWVRTALLAGLLYLPWFVWAWWYYGTPVPHTILAKSQVTNPVHFRDLLFIPWRTLIGDSLLSDLFLPTYWFYGSWPALLPRFGHFLSVLAAFAWLVPALPAAARRVSLSVFLGMFYVCAIILFPWYSPPWMLLAALALAQSFDYVVVQSLAAGRRSLAVGVRTLALLVVCIQLGMLLATAWEMRTQQRIIEHGVRRPIGEWLRANAGPSDTVFLEPLGYVGFYSRLKTYDYPGLSSPEVVAAIRSGNRRFAEVIATLRPTWLVLRPFEIADATKPENAALNDYELVRTWDARPQLDAVPILPGRDWMLHDAEFRIFRRKAGATPSETAAAR